MIFKRRISYSGKMSLWVTVIVGNCRDGMLAGKLSSGKLSSGKLSWGETVGWEIFEWDIVEWEAVVWETAVVKNVAKEIVVVGNCSVGNCREFSLSTLSCFYQKLSSYVVNLITRGDCILVFFA